LPPWALNEADIRVDSKCYLLFDGPVEFACYNSGTIRDFRKIAGIDVVIALTGQTLRVRCLFLIRFHNSAFPFEWLFVRI
jgi:hypothetical protein